MRRVVHLFFILLLIISLQSQANIVNQYSFTLPNQELRFHQLLAELRCVVCQNQSLAESNAPLAQDLKNEVYSLIKRGYLDHEIKHYLVERYGEYILFKPRLSSITFVLWLGPVIFLCGSFLLLVVGLRRRQDETVNDQNEVEVSC